MPGEDIQTSSTSSQSNIDNFPHKLESGDSEQKTNGTNDEVLHSDLSNKETEDSSLVVELPSSIENSRVENSNRSSRMTESGDESSVNTLDDISSLKTVEEDSSVVAPIDNKDDDIGSFDTQIAPDSLKEPEEVKNNEDEEPEDGWVDVIGSGDLMKKIIRKGDGAHTRPERAQLVTIRIVGRLENGNIVEDEKEKKITVGDAEVVHGIDLAIPLMELHEISEIIVKPRLAYGKLGLETVIPSNSTINYEVELLLVEDELDPEKMSFAERKTIANQKRERGNFWYVRLEANSALQCYRRALDFLDDNRTNFKETTEEQRELAALWMTVSNNMAAAQLRIGAYDAALKSVDNVLKMEPNNSKALFRKSKVLSKTGNVDEAISILKKLIELEPDNKVLHQELYALRMKQFNDMKDEKKLYKRMLGQDKEIPTKLATVEDSSRKFLRWGIILGGFTAVIATIVAYRHFHSSATI
ncbi:hypothetical protein CHUAL_000652 [Chamberlinius hualienensis]